MNADRTPLGDILDAMQRALTLTESIDFIADAGMGDTHETDVQMEAVKAVSRQIRLLLEPVCEAAEFGGVQ